MLYVVPIYLLWKGGKTSIAHGSGFSTPFLSLCLEGLHSFGFLPRSLVLLGWVSTACLMSATRHWGMKEACKESGYCSESSLVFEHGTTDCLSQNLGVGFLVVAWDVHGTQHTVSFLCFCLPLRHRAPQIRRERRYSIFSRKRLQSCSLSPWSQNQKSYGKGLNIHRLRDYGIEDVHRIGD